MASIPPAIVALFIVGGCSQSDSVELLSTSLSSLSFTGRPGLPLEDELGH